MARKTARDLIQELVDIHCRTQIRFQRRQELIQEQAEDDRKFINASSLLKPMLARLDGPIHYQRGWAGHYAIRVDSDTQLVLVEPMSDLLDVNLEDDPIISDDCLALIEKELIEMSNTASSCDQSDKESESEWKIGKQIIVPESVYKELTTDGN